MVLRTAVVKPDAAAGSRHLDQGLASRRRGGREIRVLRGWGGSHIPGDKLDIATL